MTFHNKFNQKYGSHQKFIESSLEQTASAKSRLNTLGVSIKDAGHTNMSD